jgi:serine/threonine protein kinase
MIGTRLGPCEITAKLGEGGMGEDYRTKDFHPGREVALEVLPEAFTADPERAARFEREAKLLASVDHREIAQMYAFGNLGRASVSSGDAGPTPAGRLESGFPFLGGSFPSLACRIAGALERGHDQLAPIAF